MNYPSSRIPRWRIHTHTHRDSIYNWAVSICVSFAAPVIRSISKIQGRAAVASSPSPHKGGAYTLNNNKAPEKTTTTGSTAKARAFTQRQKRATRQVKKKKLETQHIMPHRLALLFWRRASRRKRVLLLIAVTGVGREMDGIPSERYNPLHSRGMARGNNSKERRRHRAHRSGTCNMLTLTVEKVPNNSSTIKKMHSGDVCGGDRCENMED